MLFKVHWKPSEYIPEGNSLTKMRKDKTPEKTDAHFNFLYWKVIILLHIGAPPLTKRIEALGTRMEHCQSTVSAMEFKSMSWKLIKSRKIAP